MVPFATTVNVRDRLAGFIVSLASVADRWEMRPSADKDRFRQGLGRSTDSKVVALRQAVLEKCVAVKGPSPGQGVLPPTVKARPFAKQHVSRCDPTSL